MNLRKGGIFFVSYALFKRILSNNFFKKEVKSGLLTTTIECQLTNEFARAQVSNKSYFKSNSPQQLSMNVIDIFFFISRCLFRDCIFTLFVYIINFICALYELNSLACMHGDG